MGLVILDLYLARKQFQRIPLLRRDTSQHNHSPMAKLLLRLSSEHPGVPVKVSDVRKTFPRASLKFLNELAETLSANGHQIEIEIDVKPRVKAYTQAQERKRITGQTEFKSLLRERNPQYRDKKNIAWLVSVHLERSGLYGTELTRRSSDMTNYIIRELNRKGIKNEKERLSAAEKMLPELISGNNRM